MTNIAKLRSQSVFFIEESVPGVIAYPTVTDFKILALDLVKMDQETPKIKSPEITGDTRDVIGLCNGLTPAGSWSVGVLSRPIAPGLEPQESPLMAAAFGELVAVAGQYVDYKLNVSKKTYTLWRSSGHTVYYATGCTCNSYTESLGSECELRLMFEGNFMRMGWAGTTSVSTITGSTITVGESDRFSVGSKIELEDVAGQIDNNGGAGWIIVSKTGSSVDVSGAPTGITAVKIRGFLPTGLESGAPLPARPAEVTVGLYVAKVRTLSVTFTDNIGYVEDELSSSGYPSAYFEGQREVSGSMTLYFREDDTDFFEWAKTNVGKIIKIDMKGPTGHSRVTTLADTRFTNVVLNNDDPALGIQINFMATGTVAEDSIIVRY